MAIYLLNHVGASSATSNDVTTAGINTTGATFLVCAVANYQAVAAASPTDSNSNTWVGLTAQITGGGNPRIRLYYCVTPTVGSGHTFTVTSSGGYPSIAVAAFTGVAASSPFDVENGNGASNSSGSITPSQHNELIIWAAAFTQPTGTINADGNASTIHCLPGEAGLAFGGALGYGIQGTAAAVTVTLTNLTAICTVIASFKAA